LDPILNGENMNFGQTIFIELVNAKLFSIMDEKHVIEQSKA
jgi:hypothetical protein